MEVERKERLLRKMGNCFKCIVTVGLELKMWLWRFSDFQVEGTISKDMEVRFCLEFYQKFNFIGLSTKE